MIEFENEYEDYQYDEVGIDLAIQRIKDNETEKARLQELYEQRVERFKFELESKLNKLDKQIDYDLYNVGQVVKNAEDKKQTKTMWKKDYLSGTVVIKKPKQSLVKPKLEENIIKEKFEDYKKEKTLVELDWAELKKHCDIKDGKVINTVTGEDLSEYINIEDVPERVEIK